MNRRCHHFNGGFTITEKESYVVQILPSLYSIVQQYDGFFCEYGLRAVREVPVILLICEVTCKI